MTVDLTRKARFTPPVTLNDLRQFVMISCADLDGDTAIRFVALGPETMVGQTVEVNVYE